MRSRGERAQGFDDEEVKALSAKAMTLGATSTNRLMQWIPFTKKSFVFWCLAMY